MTNNRNEILNKFISIANDNCKHGQIEAFSWNAELEKGSGDSYKLTSDADMMKQMRLYERI